MEFYVNCCLVGGCKCASQSIRPGLAGVILLVGWVAGIARADNTCAIAQARIQPACGGACTSAEIDVALAWVPTTCMPACAVTPLIQSRGLCAPLASVMMHVVNPLDECGDNDVAPFPIDLQAGSFVLTNAQWQGLFTDVYLVRVEMAASFVCQNTQNPPGSGVKKVCTTVADCDPGDACVDIGYPGEKYVKAALAEICEQIPSCPTLPEWGVIVLTVLLLSAGTIVFRRIGASGP